MKELTIYLVYLCIKLVNWILLFTFLASVAIAIILTTIQFIGDYKINPIVFAWTFTIMISPVIIAGFVTAPIEYMFMTKGAKGTKRAK
jgi:hypothetical protein